MQKDSAPVVGGAGGGIFAWFHNNILLGVTPTLFTEVMQVALFAFIGAGIGEGVKFASAWLKLKWAAYINRKNDSDGKA